VATRLPSTALARSPVGELDDLEATQLGHAVELEVERDGVAYVLRWRGALLLWVPARRALLVVEQPKTTGRGAATRGRAARTFEKWSDREATTRRTIDLPTRGTWRSHGHVRRIDYRSDKRGGTPHEYTHDTGAGVRLYSLGTGLWAIRGGRLTVTARGIVN